MPALCSRVCYADNTIVWSRKPCHLQTLRCPLHKYTASACGSRVIPAKAGIQEISPWGLDARLRGHDVLLAPDLRNRHLAYASSLHSDHSGANIAPGV